jgi:hypothetical protein
MVLNLRAARSYDNGTGLSMTLSHPYCRQARKPFYPVAAFKFGSHCTRAMRVAPAHPPKLGIPSLAFAKMPASSARFHAKFSLVPSNR